MPATTQIVIDLDAKPAVGEFDQFQKKFVEGMARLKDGASIGFNHVQSATEKAHAAFRTLGSETLAMSDRFAALTRPLGMAREFLESTGVSTGFLGRALGFLTSPIGLVIGTLTGLVTVAISATHAMDENARAVRAMMAVSGLGAEAADHLISTMTLLGLESSSVTTALFRLSAQIDSGGVALRQLGISIFQSNGLLKTEGDLFLEIRDRLSQMGTAAERNAALINIFGRSGRELATVFAMSSEEFERWQRLAAEVAPWSELLQERATEHSRAVAFLGEAWGGLMTRIGAVTTPILTFVTNMTTGAVRGLSAIIEGITGLGAAINALSFSSFERIFQALGDFARVFAQEGFLTAVGAFWKTLIQGSEEAAQAVTESADKTVKAMQIPPAIAAAMQKERIDAVLKQTLSAIALVAQYDAARLARQDITEEQSIRLQIESISKQREAQTKWFEDQKTLLDTSGDQFGKEMQSVTIKHHEALDVLHSQEEKLWTDLKTLRFKDSKDLLDRLLETAGKGAETVSGLVDGQTGVVLKAYTVQLAGVGAYYESLLRDENLSADDRLKIQNDYFTAITLAQRDYFGKKHDAAQKDRIKEAEDLVASKRDHQEYFEFLGASFRAAAIQIGDFWDISGRLARNTFQAMRGGLSDFFFQLEEGTLNGKKLFEGFLGSLKRAVADFLADSVIRGFFGLGSGAGGSGGGGGLLGGLLFGAGSAAAGAATGGAGGGGGGGLLGGLLNLLGLGNLVTNGGVSGLLTKGLDALTGGGFSSILDTIKGALNDFAQSGGLLGALGLTSPSGVSNTGILDILEPAIGGADSVSTGGGDILASLTNTLGLGETASGVSAGSGLGFSDITSAFNLASIIAGSAGAPEEATKLLGFGANVATVAGLEAGGASAAAAAIAAGGTGSLAAAFAGAGLFTGLFAGKGIGSFLSMIFGGGGPSASQLVRDAEKNDVAVLQTGFAPLIGASASMGELAQNLDRAAGMLTSAKLAVSYTRDPNSASVRITDTHLPGLDPVEGAMTAALRSQVALINVIDQLGGDPTKALALLLASGQTGLATAVGRVLALHGMLGTSLGITPLITSPAFMEQNPTVIPGTGGGFRELFLYGKFGKSLSEVGAPGSPLFNLEGIVNPQGVYQRQYDAAAAVQSSYTDAHNRYITGQISLEQFLASPGVNAQGTPNYDEGGIVPGPLGAPMLATVHGGEEVLTPAQQRRERDRDATPTIILHVHLDAPVQIDGEAITNAVVKQARIYGRSGQKMFPAEVIIAKSGT